MNKNWMNWLAPIIFIAALVIQQFTIFNYIKTIEIYKETIGTYIETVEVCQKRIAQAKSTSCQEEL